MNDQTATQRLLLDCFGRVSDVVHATLDGIDEAALVARLTPTSNSIGWLIWHLSRVQDDHMSELAGRPQAWIVGGWEQQFGLSIATEDIGYGHTSDQVGAVRPTAAQLIGYFDRVHEATCAYVGSVADRDLAAIVDHSYDPPVTAEVRIVSVISDCLQHAGQASFVRGVLEAGWVGADG